MNLRHLTDDALDSETIRLARTEREVLTDILHHLREVERRRLFSKFKLPSLFSYAVQRMGYSEDQAGRRISAMRLLKELPEIEEKIESGALTLTHLARAQAVFRKEKLANLSRSNEDKLSLLAQIEKTPKREAEAFLQKSAFVDVSFSSRDASPIAIENFSEPVRTKLKRLLDIKAGFVQGVDPLVGQLADLGLEKWDPLKKAERAMKRTATPATDQPADAARVNESRDDSPRRDHIPSVVRHHVIWRDHGQCRICKSSRHLQLDHIVPSALGGTNEPDNLRLVCRSCNQRAAIEAYGVGKMGTFIDL
jgi:hypothetical protein